MVNSKIETTSAALAALVAAGHVTMPTSVVGSNGVKYALVVGMAPSQLNKCYRQAAAAMHINPACTVRATAAGITKASKARGLGGAVARFAVTPSGKPTANLTVARLVARIAKCALCAPHMGKRQTPLGVAHTEAVYNLLHGAWVLGAPVSK